MGTRSSEIDISEKKRIIIAGDLVTDVFFYQEKPDEKKINYNFGQSHQYRSSFHLGGIHFIYEILSKTLPENYEINLCCGEKKYITREILERFPSPSLIENGCYNFRNISNIFRGIEFLGIAEYEDNLTINFPDGFNNCIGGNTVNTDIKLFIINDIGKNFRSNEKLWSRLLNLFINNSDSAVILKINPDFNFDHKDFAPSYKEFLKKSKNNLIVIVNLKDLRLLDNATISYQLSWEKTTEELLYHLRHNSELQYLQNCKQLVIRLGLEGVLVLNNPSKIDKNLTGIELFFDPFSYEDQFLEKSKGNVQGISVAFLVGLVAAWLKEEKSTKNLMKKESFEIIKKSSIVSGLNLSWNMWMFGYGNTNIPSRLSENVIKNFMVSSKNSKNVKSKTIQSLSDFENTKNGTAESETNSIEKFSSVKIRLDDLDQNDDCPWNILLKNRETRSFGEIAYDIVYGDIDKIRLNFPVLQIGKLVTVDRNEIESLRSVKNIINEYLDSDRQKNPLSIAVFGPPGSGKSFAVQQLLEDRKERNNLEFLSFNLSQFTEIKQLTSVFHKIRDSSLLGRMPLVFFDEFDCDLNKTQLGWIKYFLAPMQDGAFFDGETYHPLGRAIFVFAGGVSSNYSNFYIKCKSTQENGKVKEVQIADTTKGINVIGDELARQDSKIRDFISRLRGYIDITGCDPDDQKVSPTAKKTNNELYKIKRGLVLRSLLIEKAPQIVNSKEISIDRSVLRAFIKVKKYRHGVRSMQAIIEMSNLKNRKRFEPSALPAENQLDLHVNAKHFNNLLLRDIHFKEANQTIFDLLKTSDYEDRFKQNGMKTSDKELKKYIMEIPGYLHELRFGFYKFIPSKTEEHITILPICETPQTHEYKKFLRKHKKKDYNIEFLLSIIPDLLSHANFQMYKI